MFLYDQILENLCRLDSVANYYRPEESDNEDGDVHDDISHVKELVAKRDLLIFSSSMRNFAEATTSITAMKKHSLRLSEKYLSIGPPYFRDSRKKEINLHQTVSRILHAHETRILQEPLDFVFETHEGDSDTFYTRWMNERKHFPPRLDPIVGVETEKEGRTFFKLRRLLATAIDYLDVQINDLAERRIFIQRSMRDA